MANFTHLSDDVASTIANDNGITIEDAQFVWKKSLGFNQILLEKYPLESADNINIVTKKMKQYQIQLINQIKNGNAIVEVDTDSDDDVNEEKKIELYGWENGELKFRHDNGKKFGEFSISYREKDIRLSKAMRMKGVKQFLENEDAEVTHTTEDEFYRFHIGDKSFYVLTHSEITEQCIERMKENIHQYTSSFLHDVFKIKLPLGVIEAIKGADEKKANKACHLLIDDWDEALSNAFSCDGNVYGSLLNSYDGECHEIHVEHDKYFCEFNILRID